jgi:cell wall-associated NlpC family hydrolase
VPIVRNPFTLDQPLPVAKGQSKAALARPTLAGNTNVPFNNVGGLVNGSTQEAAQANPQEQNFAPTPIAQQFNQGPQSSDNLQSFYDKLAAVGQNRADQPNLKPQDRTELTQDLNPINSFLNPPVRPSFDKYYNLMNQSKQFGQIATEGAEASALTRYQKQMAFINNMGVPEPGGWNFTGKAGAEASEIGNRAVQIARGSLGVMYRWGGNSLTKGVDCSGLTQQVYKRLGISIPRTAAQQAKSGRIVAVGGSIRGAKVGDLMFMDSARSSGLVRNGHVAIYIGGGRIIEAPSRGKPVRIRNIGNSFITTVVRPY